MFLNANCSVIFSFSQKGKRISDWVVIALRGLFVLWFCCDLEYALEVKALTVLFGRKVLTCNTFNMFQLLKRSLDL